MKKIDARGLACPAPVLETKTVIDKDQPKTVEVAVDNQAAQQNVIRFLESQNYKTDIREEGGVYHIIGKRSGAQVTETPAINVADADAKKIMVMVASDCLGKGDDGLGGRLMVNFIKTLKEMGSELWRLVFVNNGVKLTIDTSEVLDDLKSLEEQNIQILVCGTCLDHFDLLKRKQVGITTNMLDIVTAMQLADKVINI